MLVAAAEAEAEAKNGSSIEAQRTFSAGAGTLLLLTEQQIARPSHHRHDAAWNISFFLATLLFGAALSSLQQLKKRRQAVHDCIVLRAA